LQIQADNAKNYVFWRFGGVLASCCPSGQLWGSRGRRFESSHPDHDESLENTMFSRLFSVFSYTESLVILNDRVAKLKMQGRKPLKSQEK